MKLINFTVFSNIIYTIEKRVDMRSIVNNRGVYFRHVDHPLDYANFSICRSRTQQCFQKCRKLWKTLSAFIISNERKNSMRFSRVIFTVCFVTTDNSCNLISRFADLRSLFANRWLNIAKPVSSRMLTIAYIIQKIVTMLNTICINN